MKKYLIYIVTISMILVTCIILYNKFVRRKPESILKQQFQIDIHYFDYSVESFREKWSPNGDGYCEIIFKIEKITPQNINYLNSLQLCFLPITEVLPPNLIKDQFLKASKGYYLYEYEPEDIRNFKLFVMDVEAGKALLYYQIE